MRGLRVPSAAEPDHLERGETSTPRRDNDDDARRPDVCDRRPAVDLSSRRAFTKRIEFPCTLPDVCSDRFLPRDEIFSLAKSSPTSFPASADHAVNASRSFPPPPEPRVSRFERRKRRCGQVKDRK